MLGYLQWALPKVCNVIYNNYTPTPTAAPTHLYIWENDQVNVVSF